MLRIAILVLIICTKLVNGEPKVPCHFIFGDSLFDAGNNNMLNTRAKSNYSPYGVDFPGRVSTGRFTNGLTMADFIARFVGFEKLIAPYSAQMSQDILRGVNYASGVSGILPETGSQMGDRIWMDRQLQNFGITMMQLQSMVQGPVSNYLNRCLFTVNMGSNDYLNNYFMPQFYPTKRYFNPEQFSQLLILRYRYQLQILYNSGARKLAIFGLGRLGCIPAQMTMNNTTQCVEEINRAAELFNKKLISLVNYFNANLRGAKFTYINISSMQDAAPPPTGMITGTPCCRRLTSNFACERNSPICLNRDLYAFMDGYHPTQVINELAARIAFNDPTSTFAQPQSISQLISN